MQRPQRLSWHLPRHLPWHLTWNLPWQLAQVHALHQGVHIRQRAYTWRTVSCQGQQVTRSRFVVSAGLWGRRLHLVLGARHTWRLELLHLHTVQPRGSNSRKSLP